MKSVSLNVPDDKAQAFAKEFATLLNKFGVEVENKEAIEGLLPITERVKTFEDACNVLGKEHPLVLQYEQTEAAFRGDSMNEDLVAYLQLRVITAALNEGWKPEFTTDEYRYYPYFELYTEKEISKMSEEEKKKLCLWGATANYGARAGLGYVGSYDAWSLANSHCASRLAYKSDELAEYSGKQFIEIWAKFVGKL